MDFGLLRFFRHINRKVNQFQLEQFLRPGVDILCIALSPTYSWFLLFFAALRLCERNAFPGLALGRPDSEKNHYLIVIRVS